MRNINEVATWFKQNNILAKDDDLRVKVLSLYTKFAYNISNLDLKCTELTFNDNNFNLGITNTNEKQDFSKEELQIIKTINHVYGYEEVKYLILSLTHVQNCNIENLTNYFHDEIKDHLEGHQYYDFNEYVELLGNNVFFVNNNTTLTEEEKERLSKYNRPDQEHFIVFRDTTNGKLVVY